MPTDKITPSKAAETPRPVTVDIHDRRTGPYWLHVAIYAVPVLILGALVLVALVILASVVM